MPILDPITMVRVSQHWSVKDPFPFVQDRDDVGRGGSQEEFQGPVGDAVSKMKRGSGNMALKVNVCHVRVRTQGQILRTQAKTCIFNPNAPKKDRR